MAGKVCRLGGGKASKVFIPFHLNMPESRRALSVVSGPPAGGRGKRLLEGTPNAFFRKFIKKNNTSARGASVPDQVSSALPGPNPNSALGSPEKGHRPLKKCYKMIKNIFYYLLFFLEKRSN